MTERGKVVVPTMGVRKDVSDMVQTPDMMSEGVNVLVYDGAVRPRPGLVRHDNSFTQTITNWPVVGAQVNCFAECDQAIIRQNADNSWEYSTDYGATWSAAAATGTTGHIAQLFSIPFPTEILFGFDLIGNLWHADVSNFQVTFNIPWVLLGSYRFDANTTEVRKWRDPIEYDDTNDILYWQHRFIGGAWGERIFCLQNASTVVAATYAANLVVRDAEHSGPGYPNLIGFSRVNTNPGPIVMSGFLWNDDSEAWQALYKYDISDISGWHTWMWARNEEFYHVEERDTIEREFDILTPIGMRYLRRDESELKPWTATGIQQYYFQYVNPSGQYRTVAYRIGDHNDSCMVGRMNSWTINGWNVNGVNYEDYPGENVDRLERIHNLYVGARVRWFLEVGDGSSADEFTVYRVQGTDPTGGGGGGGELPSGNASLGDTLSIFQGTYGGVFDDSALIMGTQNLLLYLNRSTDEWVDVTASFYVGSMGSTATSRYVFRGSDMSGLKTILATNGIKAPQFANTSYTNNDDKADGTNIPCFRPLGDLDGDGIISGADTVVPPAKCMALANNRLILGNIPSLSGLSILISDSQDYNNGYTTEYKLADTPGDIIAMRELNAITIAIIKSDAIYHGISQVEFMGVSAPMRFELIKAGIVGPCSDASVVYLPDGRLCWLGLDGGVYIYDGTVPRDAGRHLRHMIYDYIDIDRPEWAWGTVDTKRNLLWFFFPTRTEPYGMNTGIVCSIDQGETWPGWAVQYPPDWEVMSGVNAFITTDLTYGDFPITPYGDAGTATYGSYSSSKWRLLIARRNNTVYEQSWDDGENMYTDGGFPISCIMETGWYDFDDLYAFDTFHEMHHLIEMQEGHSLNWKVEAEQSDSSIISQTDELTSDNIRHRTSYRATGRRHKFKLTAAVTRLFKWAGAGGLYSRRGGR